MACIGVTLSEGFSVRPLTVLELQRQKLEVQLLKIVEQEVDEFIIGLPKSFDGKETPQSNKVVVLQEGLHLEELRGVLVSLPSRRNRMPMLPIWYWKDMFHVRSVR